MSERVIIRLEEVGSTNSYLKDRPELLQASGTVVRTERQVQGRGRMGRTYVSLHGKNLTFSVCLHPQRPLAELPAFSLWVGVALARVVERWVTASVQLKWPNDLLLSGRKVAGILIESARLAEAPHPVLIAGIGLNCLGEVSEFPPELQEKVATLEAHASREVLKEEVFQEILAELDVVLGEVRTQGTGALAQEWLRRSAMQHRPVSFERTTGTGSGMVEGLTPEGFLRIRLPTGEEHIHASGDVWV